MKWVLSIKREIGLYKKDVTLCGRYVCTWEILSCTRDSVMHKILVYDGKMSVNNVIILQLMKMIPLVIKKVVAIIIIIM